MGSLTTNLHLVFLASASPTSASLAPVSPAPALLLSFIYISPTPTSLNPISALLEIFLRVQLFQL